MRLKRCLDRRIRSGRQFGARDGRFSVGKCGMGCVGSAGWISMIALTPSPFALSRRLPVELWMTTFALLEARDVGRVAQVCREWSVLARDDQLWAAVREKGFFFFPWCALVCQYLSAATTTSHLRSRLF